MSLHSLLQLRRDGMKPSSAIMVVLSDRAPDLDDRPDLVFVPADSTPVQVAMLDLRALHRLPVFVFVGPRSEITPALDPLLTALAGAGCAFCGSVWKDAEVTDVEELRPALRRAWGLLCQ